MSNIKIQVKRIQWNNITTEHVVLFAFALFLVSEFTATTIYSINISHWGAMRKMFEILTAGLLILVIISDAFSQRKKIPRVQLVGYIVMLCLGAISLLFSKRETTVFFVLMFLVMGCVADPQKVLKTYFVLTLTMTIIVLLSLGAGVLPNYVQRLTDRTRYYCGFIYVTYLANYFFHLLIVWVALRKKEITVLSTAVILIINYLIYHFTDTRAAFYMVFMLLFVLWIHRLFPRFFRLRWVKRLFVGAAAVLAIVAIGLSAFYIGGNPFFEFMNRLMNGRLWLAFCAIREYGISLFGTVTEWNVSTLSTVTDKPYFYVDSSYVNIMLSYGVVFLILIVIGFTFLEKRNIRKKNDLFCIAVLMLLVHSFSDPQLLDFRFDPFLLMLFDACFNVREKKQLELKNN